MTNTAKKFQAEVAAFDAAAVATKVIACLKAEVEQPGDDGYLYPHYDLASDLCWDIVPKPGTLPRCWTDEESDQVHAMRDVLLEQVLDLYWGPVAK